MTGKIINLNQARKRKARAEKSEAAEANAVSHGLSKTVRDLSEARKEKAKRDLDGHQRDDPKD